MGLLKKLAGSGMFGLLGLAATHKGLARSGMFGIGGALLAGKKPHPAQQTPGMVMSPMPQDFQGDPVGYQNALNDWISRVTIPATPIPGTGGIGGAVNGGVG
jgi:hypothetical protein